MTEETTVLQYALFDLDQTLYPMSSGLMAEIGRRINQYLRNKYRLDDTEIAQIRETYYRQYGTTLRGLMIHRGVDADDYLEYVHDIALERFIQANPSLGDILGRIPLTKVIFTNATEAHARRVLTLLGLQGHFDRIIGIEAIQYLNKPDPSAYSKALELLQARPEECILFDDSDRNLATARQMGMTTVLVGAEQSDVAHFAIPALEMLPNVLNRLDGRIPGWKSSHAD